MLGRIGIAFYTRPAGVIATIGEGLQGVEEGTGFIEDAFYGQVQ
jgi:hypothetical protein